MPSSSHTNYIDASSEVLDRIYSTLQRMIGLHRQLYDICKMEREALIAVDMKAINEHTSAKELVIETIRHAEADRIRDSAKLSVEWNVPLDQLTLNFIIQEIEPRDSKRAERFRSALTALTMLIDRARRQNESNKQLLEQSLVHVHAMKKNVLGEAVPASDTYGNQGQKVAQTGGSRLLSPEACFGPNERVRTRMALPNVMQTGRSGMVAAKAQMSTTSHNIANANTEGYSRQRVQQKADNPTSHGGKNMIGTGTLLNRTERLNDTYIEKQIRAANRDLSHLEEKDLALKQAEDIFNEMGGEGLNRLTAKFFNEFRKLANEPDNEAVRQSVRESTQAVVNDFHRLRSQVEDVRAHLDARIEGFTSEANALAEQVKDLNQKIRVQELSGAEANDLRDQRDLTMKKLATYVDVSVHQDKDGAYSVDIKGVGPLVNGPNAEKFQIARSPNDGAGKPENSYSIRSSGSASSDLTHVLKGGKIGALLEVRDQTLSGVLDRLDELALAITNSVNAIHREGITRYGVKGVDFFKTLPTKARASEYIGLSDAIANDVNNIAAGAVPDAPGDNRIAVAISQIQNMRLMENGNATVDSYYNGLVSDVGVVAGRTRNSLVQQKDITQQLDKMREQISGVSIDEETANLLQYQRSFDASAKVISVADQCLETILNLRR